MIRTFFSFTTGLFVGAIVGACAIALVVIGDEELERDVRD